MGVLSQLARKIRGHDCEMLVKRTATEVTISGTNFGVADTTIDTGSFSSKILELVKATEVAIALDNSQYLLCKELARMDDDQIKRDCKKIRLQLVMAFSQLQGILGTMNHEPSGDFRNQLADWVNYMSELHKESITYLGPGPKFLSKGSASKLKQIMRYQQIDEREMEEAKDLL